MEEWSMTIIMAFACKDGAVVVDDRQGAGGDRRAEEVLKVFPIAERAVVGFSGDNYNWITKYLEFIRGRNRRSANVTRVRQGGEEYDEYVRTRFGGMDNIPHIAGSVDGILAEFKGGHPHIYSFGAFVPPREETFQGRLSIGEGAQSADFLIRLTEFLIQRLFPNDSSPKWGHVSSTFAARLAYLWLQTLPAHETTVHQSRIVIVDTNGVKEYTEANGSELLGGQRDAIDAIIQAGLQDGILENVLNAVTIERLNAITRKRIEVQTVWENPKSKIAESQRLHYNFVRPYVALEGRTPADIAETGVEAGGE
jgi:hypothetical protein